MRGCLVKAYIVGDQQRNLIKVLSFRLSVDFACCITINWRQATDCFRFVLRKVILLRRNHVVIR